MTDTLAPFLAAFTADRLGRPAPPPAAAQVLPASASFAEVVLALDHDPEIHVARGDGSCAVIGRGDLDCLLVRSWLFGIVTTLERRLRADLSASSAWQGLLSPERLEQARRIKAERGRRGQFVATVACLQFGDLGQMGIRSSWWQRLLGVDSNRQARALVAQLEQLRNNLAHGQDVIAQDWETIVVIAGNLALLTRQEQP